jgi:hypothetical protein
MDSSEENLLLTTRTFKDPPGTHDIEIILIDDINFAGSLPDANGSWMKLYGHAPSGTNTCVINESFPGAPARSDDEIIHTIAHEIGHVFVGSGHPDEFAGPAILFNTDPTKRLMCSGNRSNLNSKLLVNSEWDKAEEWLKKNIDEKQQGQ